MSNGSASVALRVTSLPTVWVKWALYAVLAGLVFYAFWIQPAERGNTCFGWLVGHWSNVSNYSHGPLIPLIASFLLWWNVSQHGQVQDDWRPYWRALGAGGATLGIWLVGGTLNKAWENSSYYLALRLLPLTLVWQVWTLRKYLVGREAPHTVIGPCVVALAVVLYYFGIKAIQPRIAVIAGVVLLYGLALSCRGTDVFRLVFFPISFLFLMVPLNFLEEAVGFPLRMFVAKSATLGLNCIGIDAVQRGSGILSAVFQFDVADPCSGIRSLMALTTVTAAYAYVTQRVQWKRWVLFACAAPLAVLGNLARVVSIALVAQVYGQDLATKVYHDWSGFIVFPVALAAMVIIGLLLNFNYRRVLEKWTRPPEPTKPNE
jgi:exosortase